MASQPNFRKVPDHRVCTACRKTYPLDIYVDIVTGKLPCGHDAIRDEAVVTRVEQWCHIVKIDTWRDTRVLVSQGGGRPWAGWTPDADEHASQLLRLHGSQDGRHRYSYEVVSADPYVPLFKQSSAAPTDT